MKDNNINRFKTLKELGEFLLSDDNANRDKETSFTFVVTEDTTLVQGSRNDMALAFCFLAEALAEEYDDLGTLDHFIDLLKHAIDGVFLKNALRIVGGAGLDIKVIGALIGLDEDFDFDGFAKAFLDKDKAEEE